MRRLSKENWQNVTQRVIEQLHARLSEFLFQLRADAGRIVILTAHRKTFRAIARAVKRNRMGDADDIEMCNTSRVELRFWDSLEEKLKEECEDFRKHPHYELIA